MDSRRPVSTSENRDRFLDIFSARLERQWPFSYISIPPSTETQLMFQGDFEDLVVINFNRYAIGNRFDRVYASWGLGMNLDERERTSSRPPWDVFVERSIDRYLWDPLARTIDDVVLLIRSCLYCRESMHSVSEWRVRRQGLVISFIVALYWLATSQDSVLACPRSCYLGRNCQNMARLRHTWCCAALLSDFQAPESSPDISSAVKLLPNDSTIDI